MSEKPKEPKYKFNGKLKGIDMINSASQELKEAVTMQAKMAARDANPSISYKQVVMMPLEEFKEFLAAFNKVYDVEEEVDFLEPK